MERPKNLFLTRLKKKIVFFFFLVRSLFTDTPVCVPSTIQIVGASLDETVAVPCRVNADPPDVEFEWSFSTSGERFEVPHGHYTSVQDINMDRGDGLKSTSTLYDSNEAYGERSGKYPVQFRCIQPNRLKMFHRSMRWNLIVFRIRGGRTQKKYEIHTIHIQRGRGRSKAGPFMQ